MKKKKKDEDKHIITVVVTSNELERIQAAASTMEIKGKGVAVRSLALQRANQILKEEDKQ
jgi:hypothetical protein